MKKYRWSNYDKFLVIADKSNGKICSNFATFIEFKRAIAAVQKIADTKVGKFLFEDEEYTKPITSAKAIGVLEKLTVEAEYHRDFLKVANCVKINLKIPG